MTRAAETVERAARTGFVAVRRGVDRAKHAGVDAAAVAEQKLTERGMNPHHLTEALAEGAEVARKEVARSTRRTRKKLAGKAKHTRKELGKAAKQARKEAGKAGKRAAKTEFAKQAKATAMQLKADAKAAKKQAKSDRKKRRWPWLLGLAAVVSGIAYALRSKPEQVAAQPTPMPAEPEEEQAKAADRNGQRVSSKPTSAKKS